MKIAVITALSGLDNATIQDPSNGGFNDIDYIAFVDKPQQLKVWQQKPLLHFSNDTRFAERRNAKFPKVMGWLLEPGYDFYVWHDNYCEVKTHPKDIIEKYLEPDFDMAVFKHPLRDCGYQEAMAVLHAEHQENCLRSAQFMNDNNYGPHQGLFEMSSFIFRNNTLMQQALMSWWELICRYTSRDQVLFPYVVNTHKLRYKILPGSAQPYGGNNTFFPAIRGKYT